ncbi:MAG: pyridoxal phosphate-dependent aminotransferase [Humidesulfovibrio sp.]|uniref:pyridoxal phosphate-dependent aminotransferase n=1 Tax=Humidesulfovibrio sp. TaxID=2910988 RepID=UPI0027F24CBC|nr:pyridoxal phosphate-dependent aminotransferase [Humidesulfovibrio sp.]MDQ7836456.1 pyridoxal phosphate-dependent aminotransferase [Humidesulfovibrio sp.]
MSENACISKRARDITPFLVMDILEAAHRLEAEGHDVIHLEIGEPDFDTPECIKEAAKKALTDGETHYTHSLGLLPLREAICEDYLTRYGVTVHPDQVIVTQGTSPAMLLLFSSIIEACDQVILSDPAYACYDNFIRFAGGEPVRVAVSEDDSFQYRPEAIEAAMTGSTRAILLNSPANPTGTLLSAERMRAVADIATRTGASIISDEIYHGLVYEGREHSALEFTDRCFVLNGFSKLYAMTGWRLGYLIAPREFIRPMQKLCQNFFISANSVAQRAGIAALKESAADVARMKAIYDERRRYLLPRIKALGLGVAHDPTGAFYVLANARHWAERFGGSSLKLAFDILEKAHVGVTPGIDFGANAEGFLRFSYANSLTNLAQGMDRLAAYARTLD